MGAESPPQVMEKHPSSLAGTPQFVEDEFAGILEEGMLW